MVRLIEADVKMLLPKTEGRVFIYLFIYAHSYCGRVLPGGAVRELTQAEQASAYNLGTHHHRHRQGRERGLGHGDRQRQYVYLDHRQLLVLDMIKLTFCGNLKIKSKHPSST